MTRKSTQSYTIKSSSVLVLLFIATLLPSLVKTEEYPEIAVLREKTKLKIEQTYKKYQQMKKEGKLSDFIVYDPRYHGFFIKEYKISIFKKDIPKYKDQEFYWNPIGTTDFTYLC